jgi:transcriptional regulator with XRE-family HTH domain
MSQQTGTEAAHIPEWDTADRMRKALRTSRVSIEEMADYLGVSRRSVGNWINGRIEPSAQTVRLWALRTGVPYAWLCCGTEPGEPCPKVGQMSSRAGRQGSNFMQSKFFLELAS